ncbi:ATP-binding cassette domain-containing protein [Sphingomonas sp. SFZ2018-12]|nr:ATP-binding cassette domain-containing protein [Sphingomonas sp. SFZ2018-12]
MGELTVAALTVTLGGVRVLDDVAARFERGQVTAVLGPNGAGKSTLLACLAGLRRPDRGEVRIDGTPRDAVSRRDLARRIGLLPQVADVHWDVDVATLVALGRYPHRGRWGESAADRAAVAAAMAATDVARFADRPVSALSGGERARVLLARVLAGAPEWLLADEPLANLDPAHQHDALEGLRAAAVAGAGVIVVLHDLNHALRIADQVLLLAGGRVSADGPPDVVLTPARIRDTYGIACTIATTDAGDRVLVSTGRVAPA